MNFSHKFYIIIKIFFLHVHPSFLNIPYKGTPTQRSTSHTHTDTHIHGGHKCAHMHITRMCMHMDARIYTHPHTHKKHTHTHTHKHTHTTCTRIHANTHIAHNYRLFWCILEWLYRRNH